MRLLALRQQRRLRTIGTFALVLLGPVLAVATFLVMGPLGQAVASPSLRLVLLADLVYTLVVAALVFYRIAKMIAARRAHSAGSRLHLRLTGVFVLLALLPTVAVAVFATITVNMGLEGWFSDRVRNALGHSVEAAHAYQQEHRDDLSEDAVALAAFLNLNRRATPFLADGDLRQLLSQGQGAIQRGLKEAYVIDGGGEIRARGERSYLFDYERPSDEDLEAAINGDVIVIEDRTTNEFRALVRLTAFADRYLYISREVDGQIIALLDETQATVGLYRQLENERGQFLFQFGLIYLGFAVILILAAIWLGLWFAERLSRPVGRLAGAAQRVGIGDLDVRVQEEEGDDEIAMLGRLFNQMTRQLKGQRDALIEQNGRTEERRRQFDSVLSSVTSGVIGLDADGRIDFMNRSAIRLLDLVEARDHGISLAVAVPEYATLFDRLRDRAAPVVQEEIKVTRRGKLESLLVRMSMRLDENGELEGYVVAFDDVTDLVSAQRMAAWGDVARRIAHEIKNPLTPIQLSAERVRRKFGKLLEEADAEQLEQLTDVIVRQTNDLRRIVDEFSKFARMPEPERQPEDLTRLLSDAVLLQKAGQPGTVFVSDIPDGPVNADVDATMIGQALTNLIKNGGEAIESLQEKGAPEGHIPEIRVSMTLQPDSAVITISDNGIGLPPDRARLFEPYVTTREKGTGLGLPIVKKIIEEHGGSLDLLDAEPFADGAHPGAMARIVLPRLSEDGGEAI
ncbi:ATP-binding protein [Nioella aestuarii]|uniref:sensor histidine kinase NtrY-like n=1 Tax=Nioella aestuarii TaxID=1662864 RepID=UPI003D7F50DE